MGPTINVPRAGPLSNPAGSPPSDDPDHLITGPRCIDRPPATTAASCRCGLSRRRQRTALSATASSRLGARARHRHSGIGRRRLRDTRLLCLAEIRRCLRDVLSQLELPSLRRLRPSNQSDGPLTHDLSEAVDGARRALTHRHGRVHRASGLVGACALDRKTDAARNERNGQGYRIYGAPSTSQRRPPVLGRRSPSAVRADSDRSDLDPDST